MTETISKTSRSGASKPNNMGSRIVIKSFSGNIEDEKQSTQVKFINSTSSEEQLGILKSVIEGRIEKVDDGVIDFLAIVFYEAPAKHPVKCFISRHVTKCTAFQKPFTNFLTAHIVSEIKEVIANRGYDYYSERVPKVMMCIENFPCGALAVESVGVDLITKHLFFDYFFLCREELRKSTLSPTKKNDMFNLEHAMLRLIVHVVQKAHINENVQKYDCSSIIQSIIDCVYILICDEEVSMDTKSLSGILLLAAENLRINSTDAWKFLIEKSIAYSKSEARDNDAYYPVLRHKMGRLAVYSAIATTVSMDLLQEHLSTSTPAVLTLLDELLSYADGSTSEPAVTVAVSRALLQLSRSVGGVRCVVVGGRAVAALLRFVWPHLEYQLDSVRHLANQTLAACLQHCADLDRRGESAPLESLLCSVRALGEARSRYWAACRAVPALGAARVLRDLCAAPALLRAAATPHLQAAASAAIAALLSGGACAGLETSEVFELWVQPALASPAALQAVLPSAIAAHPALPQYIGSKVHGREALACVRAAPACRACVTQRALRAAAIHKDDETRILALSLVAECGRTTESVTREELDSVLWFLRYLLNAPRPGFRTALLANMNKLLKRLEDSHRALQRRGQPAPHYAPFLEQLRALCFAAALRGASHGRRSAALQLLAATHSVLPEFTREWKPEYVETLLQHLDDGYDANKASALQVLLHCPARLLEEGAGGVSARGEVRGAVSLRAARGAAAAARLQLLLARMPHRVAPLAGDAPRVREAALRPHYTVLRMLLQQLRDVGSLTVRQEAARGGAAGSLRCVADLLRRHAGSADWSQPPWSELAAELAGECVRACGRAEPVVAHHAPEGHLPECSDNAADEGLEVTAQMVLVCAWRTVKEASAVLGLLAGVGSAGDCRRSGEYLVALLMTAMHRGAVEQAAAGLAAVAHACWRDAARAQLPRRWARELLALAARGAPHATRRGAGLPAALQALVSSEVSATGRAECFNECMADLLRLASAATDASTDGRTALSTAPTAASTADAAAGVARRTLAANMLRALYRHAALEKASQPHVAAGLRLALAGFEAAAWPERTAMSLLFCALSVRTFGVTRARGAALHARNTLPAALFHARYPGLCDLMLSKLQEFEPGSAAGPGVLPVLLLLARLYPSAVESAASSFKVSDFVPLVQRCACAAELRIRRLAARALPSLLSPSEHLPYIERLLAAISRTNLLHNHWHGALLTLTSLLERAMTPTTPMATLNKIHVAPCSLSETHMAPNGPQVTPDGSHVSRSLIALTQALGPRPCYVIATEYVNVLNMLVWKFPEMVPKETICTITTLLDEILFSSEAPAAAADRGLCLADCALLYFILLHTEKQFNRILPLVNRTLLHPSYEVVLSTLDYLLIQRNAHTYTEPCNFRQHLMTIRDVTVLHNRKETSEYNAMITELSACFHDVRKYQECRLKSLQLLTLENDTQMVIINEMFPPNVNRTEWLARRLIAKIETSHENVKHMFLESLLTLARGNHLEIDVTCLVDVCRVMYGCCSAENSAESRAAVVRYLEYDFEWITERVSDLPLEEKFRIWALVAGALVTLLEDDDDVTRQRAADLVCSATCPATLHEDDTAELRISDATLEDECVMRALRVAVRDNAGAGVVASAAGALLAALAARSLAAPLLLLLALLDFRAEVCLTDDLTDECRVFDQSERYNIFLEESVWTAACADRIRQLAPHDDLVGLALATLRHPAYSHTFHELCAQNVKLFEKMADGDFVADDTVNPKIEILVRKLRR